MQRPSLLLLALLAALAGALGGCDASHEPGDAGSARDTGVPFDSSPGTDSGPVADSGTTTWGASIRADCGPDDGYALRLVLFERAGADCTAGDPLAASLDFYLFEGADRFFPIAAPQTIRSAEGAVNGMVTQCPGGSPPCRIEEDFTITFETFEEGVGASGTWEIRFNTLTASGRFDATWCDVSPPLCG